MQSVKRRSQKAGLSPGTAVHVGEQKIEKVKITVIDYDQDNYEVREMQAVEQCMPYRLKPTITWINIEGLHEASKIEEVSKCFDLHPLTIEDILNTEQRPKIEFFDNYIFFVMKMLSFDEQKRTLNVEQVSLVLAENKVITFQEIGGDVFDAVRNRIKNTKANIRKVGADYLAYALMDAVVDEYFEILEKTGDIIEELEDKLLKRPSQDVLHEIHGIKRQTIFLRRAVWPLREVISGLEREGTSLIKGTTRIYLRDLHDHTVQVIDAIETFREMISGMLDIYLSSISNGMNEVMKVLTIFASIFIPMTLVSGIYGMNFNNERSPFNMPELNWYLGYPFALGLMLIIAIAMLFFFRKKRWL
ncbi:MAG: magnesium and cobalt transport protein CorA [Nitrospiraceae bacterium]|nr:MAG: magnesium and cobalt transport protein CorA [Nitrospiraceae bacterium]